MTMQRIVLTGALALALASTALADTVTYQGPGKKPVTVKCKVLSESPSGLKLELPGKGGEKVLLPGQVIRVFYDDSGLALLEYGAPFGAEDRALKAEEPKKRAAEFDKALAGFRDLEEKAKASARARRFLQYKIANVIYLQSRDDPKKTDDAIKALSEYRTRHPNSFPIVSVLETLGRLQEEQGQFDEARKTLEELGELPDIPAPLKLQSDILVSRLYLRGKKYDQAEKRLTALTKGLATTDPNRPFVLAYLAESQLGQEKMAAARGLLEEALKASPDPKLRATAYNLLGDFYRKQGKSDEAFWQYLRVDALFPEDRDEHAKALYHLGVLFRKVKGDNARATRCWEQLQEARFNGTVYQKLAAEKK